MTVTKDTSQIRILRIAIHHFELYTIIIVTCGMRYAGLVGRSQISTKSNAGTRASI